MSLQENEHDDLDFIPLPTPQLRAMMSRYRQTLSTEQYDGLMFDIKKMYSKYSAILSTVAPGAERAMAAHRLITPPIEQSAVQPTCTKGCGACCHLEVEVTRDEGQLLARIVDRGYDIDRARLASQAARERRGKEWGLPISASSRCVFLGSDDACGIYEFRPSICRKHVVVSDPRECMKEGGLPQPILIPLAELVLSAALSQPGNPYQSLSKSLSEALHGAKNQFSQSYENGPQPSASV